MVDNETLRKLDILIYSTAKLSKTYEEGVKSVLTDIEEFAKKQSLDMTNSADQNIARVNSVVDNLTQLIQIATQIKDDLEGVKDEAILQIKNIIENFEQNDQSMLELIKTNRTKLKRRIY
jgi:uncharacterized transporter YbjL